jgi:RHS repeat-associated protein
MLLASSCAPWRARLRAGRRCVLVVLAVLALPTPVPAGPVQAANFQDRTSLGHGTPNHFDPRSVASVVVHPHIGGPVVTTPPPPGGIRSMYHVPMQPGALPLRPDVAARFVGSDGALEIEAPAGAVTGSDLAAAASGRLTLGVSQVLPGSGSSAGGTGLVSFGTYLLQLVDGSGRPAAHGLRRPVTLKYHVGHAGGAADLAHAFVTFNTGPPIGSPAEAQARGALGAFSTRAATLDPAAQTISVQAQLTTASTTASFNSNSPVASFGNPDPAGVGLSSGALTFNEPIEVPAGPGGLEPPLNLSYSSENVDEQHSWQGAAGWVGEGWNLSLGAVTWSEENVSSASTTGVDYRSIWQLADPFGTASQLIPPTQSVATYFDDTGHEYFDSDDSTTPYPNQPVQFHTADESQVRVYSYVNPDTNADLPDDGGGARPTCFRVYLPNGIMEEFGCTPTSVTSDAPSGVPDSLQYYYSSGAQKDYISGWFLDLITDPEGNQIHITYQHHNHHFTGGENQYVRDMVPATIEWDSPTCNDTTSYCRGTAWQPLMRVSFVASSSVARPTNSPSGCNTSDPNLRCDDPKDLTSSGGLPAPEVVNTFALNDLDVQVRGSGAASWSTLKDYQFSYEINGPGQLTDPVTGLSLSSAGYFDLTQLRVIGDDGTTALPTRTFTYTHLLQHYLDDAFSAKPSGNCGWAWNGDHGCHVWNHSRDGNDRYLSTIANGMGLAQSFTWAEARNNTHGVPVGNVLTDPLACDGQEETSPCFKADDRNFSHIVLTGETDSILQASPTGNAPLTTTTVYTYRLTPLTAQPCSDCKVGMYWGSQNDTDELDFYNARFMGFAQTSVTRPDSSVEVHSFNSTAGIGVYDTSQVGCDTDSPCHNDPWWSPGNALHGREAEVDSYDTDGTTLLTQVKTQYQLTCPPAGVTATPPSNFGNWNGNRVTDVDHSNPTAVCDIQVGQVDTYTFDGASGALAVPHRTVAYAYDQFDRITSQTTTVDDGGATGSPTTLVQRTDHVWNDALSPTVYGVTGTYLVDVTADQFTADAPGTVRTACSYLAYDGQAFATGQQSTLTRAEATTVDRYTSCGTSGNGFALTGLIHTAIAYDQYGNRVADADADAGGGIAGHTGCAIGGTPYTDCIVFDGTFAARPQSTTNALGQTTRVGYTSSPAGGFGLWPTSVIDANGQTTSTGYDGLGRVTSTTLPAESAGLTTTATTYTDFCAATGAQMPCLEVDTTRRLNSTTTVTDRSFYDGWGRLVETRSPGPANQDVVQYALYDGAGRPFFSSVRYFVPAYTGGPGTAAFAPPDTSQPGTSTAYTNLRMTTVKDALSFPTTSTASVGCGLFGDSACYQLTSTVDPLGHQKSSAADALGRQVYSSTYTGNSSATYAVYATTSARYDLQGNVVGTVEPNRSSTLGYTYDDAGRKTGMSDPDRGSESYSYDPEGNLVASVDARGGAGTVFIGYDGLNRPVWRSTSSGPAGAYVTDSYDSTAGGNPGIGHLTGETFTAGTGSGLSGSYGYTYDTRGRETGRTLTVGAASYALQTSYDDAGQVVAETYPTGEVVTNAYTSQGWLAGVSRQQGGTLTTLLDQATYTGTGGAVGRLTGASLGGGTYTYRAAYDLLGRLTDTALTRTSGGVNLFEQQRTFDGAGNVVGATTTVPQGTDVQRFCYDEQDRLTWAGTTGTPPCTGTAITPGTLTAAAYTQSFGYDTLDRLTGGTLGSYTYGDPAHLHAATAIGIGYSASYDASGNMTCRAATAGTTCAGATPTGARLSYDSEGRLSHWQSAPAAPGATDDYLYDGAGERVAQQVTQNGTTTTTVYVGDVEEVAATGSTTTTTTYYYAGDGRIALAVGGVVSYLASDGLGTATVALDAGGNPEASVLYAPYGTVRYGSGVMPTRYGFTGQRADAVTGLDYYGARYYDSVAGQFTSADTWLAGLNRCGYVSGNPETLTDSTGHDEHCEKPHVLEAASELAKISAEGLAMLYLFMQLFNALSGAPPSLQEDVNRIIERVIHVDERTGRAGVGSLTKRGRLEAAYDEYRRRSKKQPPEEPWQRESCIGRDQARAYWLRMAQRGQPPPRPKSLLEVAPAQPDRATPPPTGSRASPTPVSPPQVPLLTPEVTHLNIDWNQLQVSRPALNVNVAPKQELLLPATTVEPVTLQYWQYWQLPWQTTWWRPWPSWRPMPYIW